MELIEKQTDEQQFLFLEMKKEESRVQKQKLASMGKAPQVLRLEKNNNQGNVNKLACGMGVKLSCL